MPISMKFLKSIVNKFIPEELLKPLGRGIIEECNKKIDLSNEDHCGPCGQHALKKVNFNDEKNKINKNIR